MGSDVQSSPDQLAELQVGSRPQCGRRTTISVLRTRRRAVRQHGRIVRRGGRSGDPAARRRPPRLRLDLGAAATTRRSANPGAASRRIKSPQSAGGAKDGRALFIAADGFPVVDAPTGRFLDPQPRWTGSINQGLTFALAARHRPPHVKRGGQVWNGTKGRPLLSSSARTRTRGCTAWPEDIRATWNPSEIVVGPGAEQADLSRLSAERR